MGSEPASMELQFEAGAMAVRLQGAEPADGPAVADPVLAHGCSVLAYRRAPEATLSAGP